MATTISTPSMNLQLPVVGVEPGPQFAVDVNTAFTIVDGHNHSPGFGVPISQAGILLNGNLSYSGYSAANILSVILNSQGSAPSTVGTIYENGNDLHYINGNGLDIQMTNNSGIVGSPGSISGISGTASVNYVSPGYFFYSATLTPANIAVASISLANVTASSATITISPPNPLSASYSLTLPTALPASQSILEVSSTGQITAVPTDFQSLTPAGGMIMYGGSSIPTGWLLCNGQAVSRTTFATLFGAISTTYGVGDGSTTFNVPNMQAAFPRGAGFQTVGGVSYSTSLGTTQSDAMQGHIHSTSTAFWTVSPSSTTWTFSGSTVPIGSNDITISSPVSDGSNGTPRTSTETRPVNVGVNYIMKT